MKYHTIYAVVILTIAVFGACTKKQTEKAPSFSVGMVTDIGGIDDASFNQGTWEGLERFAQDMSLTERQYTYLQSGTDADYIPNLSTLADDGVRLIIAAGFLFEDAIAQASQNFPDTQFLLIDTKVSNPNVASAIFSEEQGSFLVGVVAALQSQAEGKTKVGFLGGMEFDVIHRFEAGFEAGVQAVAPELEIMIEYAGDFAAPQIGQALAAKMYDSGASVVFHASGATGNGALKEVKDRALAGSPVWVIGVDRDQYQDGVYAEGKSVTLTSMVKRVDVAAYDVAKMSYEGTFPGGQTLTFDLSNGGVSMPQNNPNVRAEFLETVEEYKAKVLSGEITVPKESSRLQNM